jgi:hypothetical protein
MKFLQLFALLLPSVSLAGVGSLTWSWDPTLLNADGSAAAGISYNVYVGPAGAEVLNANNVATTFTYAVPGGKTVCAQFTAVENGIESARTPEVCGTASFPVPLSPTNVTVK